MQFLRRFKAFEKNTFFGAPFEKNPGYNTGAGPKPISDTKMASL
jgi:hypothetical protein